MITINIGFEDALSKAVMEKILQHCGEFSIDSAFGGRGFGFLKTRIKKYNQAANSGIPFFILTDLDSASCPRVMIEDWLGAHTQSANLIFRIAVTEVESWILADRQGMSRFLSIAINRLPQRVDEEADPKRTLVQLATSSPLRAIRQDLVPKTGSTAQVGPNYNARLSGFVGTTWSIDEAIQHSPSLSSTVDKLREYAATTHD